MKLDGQWKLYLFEQYGTINAPEELNNYEAIDATVPGNVELDLIHAGILPKDIFMGMNIRQAEKYETYEYWYKTEFITPAHQGKMILHFEGVDCIATYWLNGWALGKTENALIAHSFDVTSQIAPMGERNSLCIRIFPAIVQANQQDYDLYNIDCHPQPNADGIGLRKPPHCFGWDIMPRAVSAGIWRSVTLYEQDEIQFNQFHYHVLSCDESYARIRFLWEIGMDSALLKRDIYVQIRGNCGDSAFELKEKVYFKLGKSEITLRNPKLWWPAGYGDANIYETEISLVLDGNVVSIKKLNVGIRTARLERTATTDGKNGYFRFVVNSIPVMCKGSNWVPLDVYHSRDAQRYKQALELASDIGCNILRCWGGNVYEDEPFYDYCDRHGIMVWQDFAMACAGYKLHKEFYETMEKEAEQIVRRLRSHPSIVLWSGDNECDAVLSEFGSNALNNKITREILPMVIHNNDHGRSYLPSSPCFDEASALNNDIEVLPEYHLWGPRDYFKSDYYKQSKAHFVSETGYHGCPSEKSLQKFIDADHLWPNVDNEQWNLHSSDQRNNPARVQLVTNQIKQFFGEIPSDLPDYAVASQISQAEAKKYFIERIRGGKPTKSGIIWWNLLDGWPQISDAVVDYFFEKKLAYSYIKCSQQPFLILANEIENWKVSIIAANDTLSDVHGTMVIREADKVIYEGSFHVKENCNTVLTQIPVMYSDKRLLSFEWDTNLGKGFNHYLCGYPAFSFDEYKNRWLPEIQAMHAKYSLT